MIIAFLGVGAFSLAALATTSVHVREIGRSDPKRAASYSLPLFNFSETYVDGVVLGLNIGSTRAEAIAAAEHHGFQVSPASWGDYRAGGADLYARSDLVTMMRHTPSLIFRDPSNQGTGMIVEFLDNRVAAIRVHHINFELI